jgi:hypothetical protein
MRMSPEVQAQSNESKMAACLEDKFAKELIFQPNLGNREVYQRHLGAQLRRKVRPGKTSRAVKPEALCKRHLHLSKLIFQH